MTIVNRSDEQRSVPFLVETDSTIVQQATEHECRPYFVDLSTLSKSHIEHLQESGILSRNEDNEQDDRDPPHEILLLRDRHYTYLSQLWSLQTPDKTTKKLASHYISLDASRSWMIYWTLHACDLLDVAVREDDDGTTTSPSTFPSKEECCHIVSTLESFWTTQTNAMAEDSATAGGGFGGGPQQLAHAATNYAAVNALVILASRRIPHALELLKQIRKPLLQWMRQMQQARNGSFRMHDNGEMDVRATYCLYAIASLLNLQMGLNATAALDYILQCQTYEGGFGGEPFAEAHGGYTFCATAAVWLVQRHELVDAPDVARIDLDALKQWLVLRQMSGEGGFNGRSNKLVDGCYSFWQGGAHAVVSDLRRQRRDSAAASKSRTVLDRWLDDEAYTTLPVLFDRPMLERYILLCGQEIYGGLRDKPSKKRDFYHSCYCLSGLSTAQHYGTSDGVQDFGHASSRVARTHPVYNLRIEHVKYIQKVFANEPIPGDEER